jgi:hypothetical protein
LKLFKQAPAALRPELAEHQPCLDGFSMAHFIGQEHALAQWRAQRE